MRPHIIFLLSGLLFSTGALAADRVFEPIPAEGQTVEFKDGEVVLITKTDNAFMVSIYEPRDKKSAWLKMGVKNLGQVPFNISEKSVVAATAEGPLEVMTYEDLNKEQKRQELWAGFATGLVAASNTMAASNAGHQTSYGTYNSTTNASAYDSGGSAHGTANTYGSYSGSTYNATEAYQAQMATSQQNQALVDRQTADSELAKQGLQGRALKANTLSPNEFVLGDIRFSLPKRAKNVPAEVVFTVDVGGTPVKLLYREKQ